MLEDNQKPVVKAVSKYPDNLSGGWIIYGDGSISKATYNLEEVVKAYFDQGNWRATKEEAELEVKRRAVIQKMRGYGFTPDWGDIDQRKYFFQYCNERQTWFKDFTTGYKGDGLFEVYYETEEKRQACIDALGDEMIEVLG